MIDVPLQGSLSSLFANRKIKAPEMARGWESKSVEQQQAEMADKGKSRQRPVSAAEQKRNREREGLLLSRTRLVRQLEAASHAEHRRMLEQALGEIERQLASFEEGTETPGT
ncbi:MAG: hypothetical protein WCC04_02910 [Terriglobales bacterium]